MQKYLSLTLALFIFAGLFAASAGSANAEHATHPCEFHYEVELGPGVYDDTELPFYGYWVHKTPEDGYNLPEAYNGTLSLTGYEDSSVCFYTTGSRVTIIYYTDSLGGKAWFGTQNNGPYPVDYYSSSPQWQVRQSVDVLPSYDLVYLERRPSDDGYAYIDAIIIEE